MDPFSVRQRLRQELGERSVSTRLISRVISVIRKNEMKPESHNPYDYMGEHIYNDTPIEMILYDLGVEYNIDARNCHQINLDILKDELVNTLEWFYVYDVIEKYLEYVNPRVKEQIKNEFDKILAEERSQYRIVEYKVVPNFNDIELGEINNVKGTPFESVNKHIQKAISSFSDRQRPDYANCIKDSISAVEAMCCHITSNDNATLGKALSELEKAGIKIHSALVTGFKSLYGYSSDQGGIRHGNVEFEEPKYEDARYMLVTCTAFINYLYEKYKQT